MSKKKEKKKTFTFKRPGQLLLKTTAASSCLVAKYKERRGASRLFHSTALHTRKWTYALNTNQLIKEFKTFPFKTTLHCLSYSRKSNTCLVKLWSHGVWGINSESLWHVLWFLHLLFFILSFHVIFIVAASMQPFVVNLYWWILSNVLFFSLCPPLWRNLWGPPSLYETWAPSKRTLSELYAAQL